MTDGDVMVSGVEVMMITVQVILSHGDGLWGLVIGV